jgi:RNA polymerase sigma-B factor
LSSRERCLIVEDEGPGSNPVAGSTHGVLVMPLYRVDDGASDIRGDRDLITRSLLHRAAMVTDPTTRQCLFEEAVLLNQSMARALAQEYGRRGVDPEDLVQVAMLGLVKAVRGYTPGAERAFAAYAVPTIRGEIKRYFRDRGWMIRPPRSLQELNRDVRIAEPELAQRLQRTPTTYEVADHLGVDADAVNEAREAGGGYQARSLDGPVGDSGQLLCDVVADPGEPFEMVDAVLTLEPALKILGARERGILRLRFVDNLTQEHIGQRLGVSQMQVSRLLTGILAKLRKSIEDQRAA